MGMGTMFNRTVRTPIFSAGRTAATLMFMLLAFPALAGETVTVELGKVTVLRPAKKPAVVMMANPTIATAVIESPRTMFITGRQLGETQLVLFDEDEKEFFNQDVVVVPAGTRHVSVHRNTEDEETLACTPRCVSVSGGSSSNGFGSFFNFGF